MGAQGENKHLDPIFLLQFSNALYMADICAKFEKNHDCSSFSFKGSYCLFPRDSNCLRLNSKIWKLVNSYGVVKQKFYQKEMSNSAEYYS